MTKLTLAGLAAVLFALTSCGPKDGAVAACEAFIQSRLKAPSTYKQISSNAYIQANGKQGWASVEYDAANSFGVPLRSKQVCTFDTPNAAWPSSEDMKQAAELAAIGNEDGQCCNDDYESKLDAGTTDFVAEIDALPGVSDAEVATPGQ